MIAPHTARPSLGLRFLRIAGVACLLVLWAGAASAQANGFVTGRVFSQDTGASIDGVTVILDFPEPEDGSVPPQLVANSGIEGDYEFEPVPPGFYNLTFVKSGFRTSVVTNVEVTAGGDTVIDFPLPRQQLSATGEVMDLEAFAVDVALVGDLMNNLELRLDADQQLNLLSAEDFSKFAASDVADALKRVAGVNVVEGQFAVIRGLEDRYSSTLYNGAPVPSPDPDSQSVQLDLFPSDIVSNLEIGKTFSASSASNSAAGSVGIITHDYPEEWTFKASAGSGFNERTLDFFTRLDHFSPIGVDQGSSNVYETDFSALVGGRTELFGREFRIKAVFANEVDYETTDGNQGISQPLPGRLGRGAASGGIATGELDRKGPVSRRRTSARDEQTTYYLGVGVDLDEAGAHRIDGSAFVTQAADELVEQRDNFTVEGWDITEALADPEGASQFFEDNVFSDLRAPFIREEWFFDFFVTTENDGVTGGKHAFFSPLFESRTFERSRELRVFQLNGDHELDEWVEGLKMTWVANYSEAYQNERTFNARYSLDTLENLALASSGTILPDNVPATIDDLNGTPIYASRNDLVYGENDIDENLYFSRIDFEYEFEPHADVEATFKGGFWFEQANRTVISKTNVQPTANLTQPGALGRLSGIDPSTYDPSVAVQSGPRTEENEFSIVGFTPQQMGRNAFLGANFDQVEQGIAPLPTGSDLKREIRSWHGELKLTVLEDVDVIGGLRIEDLRITSQNDPFQGDCFRDEFVNGDCPPGNVSGPRIFPSRFFFFDRADNPALGEAAAVPSDGFTFNDEIVGVTLPIGPNGLVDCITVACVGSVVNGEIDEFLLLPSLTLNYRPTENLIFRFGYSQTVARPSFRELAYYASQESGSDQFIVGNPALGTSDVENFDGRFEYTFGDFGDLLAFSVFYKLIDTPIEEVFLVDFRNVDAIGLSEIRTFTNNPDTAELFGIELEGRRTLDFIGGDWSGGKTLEYFSIGGNFTWIDAQIRRDPTQILRSSAFSFATDADIADGTATNPNGLSKKRPLFGQPEWIANADITFDNPDWGTKATLSIFAISEVLDAVGAASLSVGSPNEGFADAIELDRYLDKFYQMDFVVSQTFEVPGVPGEFSARASVKNLTDSTRKVIYDQSATNDDISERNFKVGRDYSFALGYVFTF